MSQEVRVIGENIELNFEVVARFTCPSWRIPEIQSVLFDSEQEEAWSEGYEKGELYGKSCAEEAYDEKVDYVLQNLLEEGVLTEVARDRLREELLS